MMTLARRAMLQLAIAIALSWAAAGVALAQVESSAAPDRAQRVGGGEAGAEGREALTSGAPAAATAVRSHFPGTGISIVAPKGFVRSTFSTGLSDLPNRSFIGFLAVDGAGAMETFEESYKVMYPRAPVDMLVDGAQATLYQKIARTEGGFWDGLTLVLRKSGRVIVANAQYMGDDPDEILRLRQALLSIQWDGTPADTEAAFGVTLQVKGLRLVPHSLGALSYTESGGMAKGSAALIVSTLPLAPQLNQSFPEICRTVLAPASRGNAVEGPHLSEDGKKRVCEVWSAAKEQRLLYTALVVMSSDSLILVSAWSEDEHAVNRQNTLANFRSAVANMTAYNAPRENR